MFLISACLMGIKSRYDEGDNFISQIKGYTKKTILIPVCPEQMGGLPTPREPAEIMGGDGSDVLEGKAVVINKKGKDVTANFIKGAEEVLRVACNLGINKAILKTGSPSCGCGRIRDGSFRGVWLKGDGVTTALLKKNQIKIYTEDHLPFCID